MSIYESNHRTSMWGEPLKIDSIPNTTASTTEESGPKFENKYEVASEGMLGSSKNVVQEAKNVNDKVSKRLAQNREAARKSRMRKKVYVQQLELSQMKLAQLDQELRRARQQLQGIYNSAHKGDSCQPPLPGSFSSGVAEFAMEYGHWVEEQNRQICELRKALQAHITDLELGVLVDSCMKHYDNLFRLKTIAAKSDVLYFMCGMWETPVESFFQWIGGFRPSDLIKVLSPQLDPLTEKQSSDLLNLKRSCHQTEDALSQGFEKLQHSLAETLVSSSCMGLAAAMEKLEVLVRFLDQADDLRQQTILQMHRVLTIRQTAQALLALCEYFHRLRALSCHWAARPFHTA